MRRLLVLLVVGGVLAVTLPATAGQSSSHPKPTAPLSTWCRYTWVDGHRTYTRGVYAMIDCFARALGVDRSTARQVADDESSGYAYAKSPGCSSSMWDDQSSDCYEGVYQAGAGEQRTWWQEVKARFKGRLLALGRAASRLNARAAVIAALWHVHLHGWGSRCHPWCTYG